MGDIMDYSLVINIHWYGRIRISGALVYQDKSSAHQSVQMSEVPLHTPQHPEYKFIENTIFMALYPCIYTFHIEVYWSGHQTNKTKMMFFRKNIFE